MNLQQLTTFSSKLLVLGCVGLLVACNQSTTPAQSNQTLSAGLNSMIEQQPYGTLPNGEVVTEYTMTNKHGTSMSVISYGGIITALKTPDKHGEYADIVLGYDKLEDYLTDSNYFGALIGRFGNRIGEGKFSLNGKTHSLPQNNGDNHLHGGHQGYDKKNWFITAYTQDQQPGLKLQLLSPDGDQGYPGNALIQVNYLLTNNNELIIDYKAHSDQDTPMNLTQHTYFNLAGEGDILSHELTIAASNITPVDSGLIPTGEFQLVEGTAFDFRTSKKIGQDINLKDTQLAYGLGYDHNYVLDKPTAGELTLAATVVEPLSGRVLEILTQEPGIQFYSGNFLDGQSKGKGLVYQHRNGFCLEPQHYPDSPNIPHFPSTILKAGDTYSTKMIYRFSVNK
ncbi:aldose epimerase family protein [Algibacillus agarilyticus]|uniref:aldose epimerase family protein n=1 Tax=Algibacillus agarilyticus TaxID=2234133 RepID=UPI0018E536E4|nr:aldose epimerase family protein [Algibacillus agarilyticus]